MATVFFVERLPRIQAVQMALCVSHVERERFSLDGVRIQRLSERDTGETCNLLHWDVPDLCVRSLSGLRLREGVLHARFKAGEGPCRPSSPRDDLLLYANEGECRLHIQCLFCCRPLVDHRKTFSRLLPLPSESWGEFSGDAFCHKHLRVGERRGTVEAAPGCLAPRRGDCLVSSSSLLVWSTDLVPDCLTTAERRESSGSTKQSLACARCNFYLGVNAGGGNFTDEGASCGGLVCLHRSQVLVKRDKAPPDPQSRISPLAVAREEEDWLAARLFSVATSTSSFRLLVQDDQRCCRLYVWMLNTLSEVKYNSHPSTETSLLARFTGHSETSDEANDTPSHFPIRTSALKLLYKCPRPTQSVGRGTTAPPPSPSLGGTTTRSGDAGLGEEHRSRQYNTGPTSRSERETPNHIATADRRVAVERRKTNGIPRGPSHSPQQAGAGDSSVSLATTRIDSAPSVVSDERAVVGTGEGRREGGQAWSEDPSVELVVLPSSLCLRLSLLLADSTRALPPEQRTSNGFSVGFLRFNCKTVTV